MPDQLPAVKFTVLKEGRHTLLLLWLRDRNLALLHVLLVLRDGRGGAGMPAAPAPAHFWWVPLTAGMGKQSIQLADTVQGWRLPRETCCFGLGSGGDIAVLHSVSASR